MLPILLQIKKKWNSTIKELIPTQKLELFGGEAHTSYWGAPVIVMVQDLSSYQTWMENWSLILMLANDYHKQPAYKRWNLPKYSFIHFLAYIQGGKCCPYDHATSRTQGGRKIFTYQSICDILYMYLNHLAKYRKRNLCKACLIFMHQVLNWHCKWIIPRQILSYHPRPADMN